MAQPTIPLPTQTVEKVEKLAKQLGDYKAGLVLGLSLQTIHRILAGRPVTRGTFLQLEQALSQVA